MSLLLADDGTVESYVSVDVPVSVLVNLQRLIKIAIPTVVVTVTAALVKQAIFHVLAAVNVTVSVGMQRKISKFFNVPVTIILGLQRFIKLTFGVNVSVAVNATERITLHVLIAVTSTIVVFMDALAIFFGGGGSPGSRRNKKKARE